MSEAVLIVKNISKIYKEYKSEWNRVLSWFGINQKAVKLNTVLQDINFSILSGEAVAIAGQNGAGKSTLLKIITRTLKPSTGQTLSKGRIAAILELGMGFHPELTGRQNVYHSAGLMGFSKEDMDKVISDIQEFAEIGNYFDEPVRTYSSGMQVRVAFAVATAYRPDVLIVDEALSVGDTYFQHKSFAKIKEFQSQGTTLLLVSHDREAIQSVCQRVILLEKGKIIQDGEPEAVMDFYNALIAQKENSKTTQVKLENGKTQTISGTGEAKVTEIKLYNTDEKEIECLDVSQEVRLCVKVKVNANISSLVLGFSIKDRLGQTIFGTTSKDHNIEYNNLLADQTLEFNFKFKSSFGVGSYSISTALALEKSHINGNLEWKDMALLFEVINISKANFIGINWLDLKASSHKDIL